MTARRISPAVALAVVATVLNAPVSAAGRPAAPAKPRAATGTVSGTGAAARAKAKAKARKATGQRGRRRVVAAPFAGSKAHGVSGIAGPSGAAAPVLLPTGSVTTPLAQPATTIGALLPAVTAATVATSPADPAPATAPPAPTPTPPAVTSLGVQVDETPTYRMLLSRGTVSAGLVRLQLVNTGEDPHNALIVRSDGTGDAIVIPQTAPGKTAMMSVSLPAGEYRLFCTLAVPVVHEAAGMRATLTVTP